MTKIVMVLPHRQFDEVMEKGKVNDSNIESKKKTYVISICDTNTEENTHWFKENHRNVLNLDFDDVGELDIEETIPFSVKQAKQIVNFLIPMKDVEDFVLTIHCAAGVSRSGAVGAFANEFFRLNYNEFKNMNRYIHPNQYILATLNRYVRENEIY